MLTNSAFKGLLLYMLNLIENGKREAREKEDELGLRFLEGIEEEVRAAIRDIGVWDEVQAMEVDV